MSGEEREKEGMRTEEREIKKMRVRKSVDEGER